MTFCHLCMLYNVKWDNGIVNDYFKRREEINVIKIHYTYLKISVIVLCKNVFQIYLLIKVQ
jgi:hypothetical protein